jgi:hypothetical protein
LEIIGDEEKLAAFLDQNPNIPREKMSVDDYSFGAYKSVVGFKSFQETDKERGEGSQEGQNGRTGFEHEAVDGILLKRGEAITDPQGYEIRGGT